MLVEVLRQRLDAVETRMGDGVLVVREYDALRERFGDHLQALQVVVRYGRSRRLRCAVPCRADGRCAARRFRSRAAPAARAPRALDRHPALPRHRCRTARPHRNETPSSSPSCDRRARAACQPAAANLQCLQARSDRPTTARESGSSNGRSQRTSRPRDPECSKLPESGRSMSPSPPIYATAGAPGMRVKTGARRPRRRQLRLHCSGFSCSTRCARGSLQRRQNLPIRR